MHEIYTNDSEKQISFDLKNNRDSIKIWRFEFEAYQSCTFAMCLLYLVHQLE